MHDLPQLNRASASLETPRVPILTAATIGLTVIILAAFDAWIAAGRAPAPGDWFLLPGFGDASQTASGCLWQFVLDAADGLRIERDTIQLAARGGSALAAALAVVLLRSKTTLLGLIAVAMALALPTRIAGDPYALIDAGRHLAALALVLPLLAPRSWMIGASVVAAMLASSLDTGPCSLGQAAILAGFVRVRGASSIACLGTALITLALGLIAHVTLGPFPEGVAWWRDIEDPSTLANPLAFEAAWALAAAPLLLRGRRAIDVASFVAVALLFMTMAWTSARSEPRHERLAADTGSLQEALEVLDHTQGQLIFVNVPIHARPWLLLLLGEHAASHVHLETWDTGSSIYVPEAWSDLEPASTCIRWKGSGFRVQPWSETLQLESFPGVVSAEAQRTADPRWISGRGDQTGWSEPDDVIVEDKGSSIAITFDAAGPQRLAVAAAGGRRTRCSAALFRTRSLRDAWFRSPWLETSLDADRARIVDWIDGFGPVVEAADRFTLRISGRLER